MWWDRAGFGRFVVVNELREADHKTCKQEVHVFPGSLTKLQVAGESMNTLSGLRRNVVINLLKEGAGQPGTKAMVNLGWRQLLGPPVPGSWRLEYEISAPNNEQDKLVGSVDIETDVGSRPMIKYTFRYEPNDEGAWYAIETENFDWKADTWSSEPVALIGTAPAVRIATETEMTGT